MNSTTLSSYFVNIKIPLKHGHAYRTGLIVAYDSSKDKPQTEDLLMLAYITKAEKDEWDHDKSNKAWEVNFFFEDTGQVRQCEVRSWENADGEGYFALLTENSNSDEGRRYEAFKHFKERKILRPHDKGVMVWTLLGSRDILTNLEQQVDDNPLSYRFEKPKRDNDANVLLAEAGEHPEQSRQKADNLRQSLVGAAVFRDNGQFVGCCYNPTEATEYIKARCAPLDFDIAAALEKCGRSMMHEAIEEGLINAEALAKTCTEIKEYFSQVASARDLDDIKDDFGKQLHKKVFPHFNGVTLERFLLHTRSGLKHLLASSNLLIKWKEMLSSLQQIGRTSIASLALLGLLSGSSVSAHAEQLAKLHGLSPNTSLDAYPLLLASIGIRDNDIIHLAVFIRSIQKDEPLAENNWHKPFGRIKEYTYQFALDLRDTLKDKNKQALCELMDKYYPDKEDKYRKRHIELALALYRLAMPETDIATLPDEWPTLIQAIGKDIFCFH